jgi:hypothetical protein
MDIDAQTAQIIKTIKQFKDGNLNVGGGYGLMPWILFLISIIIIFIYLIKIEISSNGKNWETNKCSSKYVFFSGFLKNDGDASKTTYTNFNECIDRALKPIPKTRV